MDILDYAYKDFPTLLPNEKVSQALHKFRDVDWPHKILYFYVVDQNEKLVGVVPTRLLLTAKLDQTISDIMRKQVKTISHLTSPEEARELFVKHKFLALPVVNSSSKLLGMVDIEKFTQDLGDLAYRTDFDDVYELLGLQNMTQAKPFKVFILRFPWLMSTLAAGTICALMASHFEYTLQKSIMLTFFLTLVLGLNEAVTMQAATSSIQWFHQFQPDLKNFGKALAKELTAALMIAGACGLAVGTIVFIWKGSFVSASAIGGSLSLSTFISCMWGLIVPFITRRLQIDPKVAAAPMALGLADVSTLFIYFSIGSLI